MNKIKNLFCLLLIGFFVLVFYAETRAATTFTTTLDGAQQVPPSASTAIGFARVTLNDNETVITVALNFSGLSTSGATAHIHGSASPGQSAPVIFTLDLSTPTPGTIRNLNFNVTAAQVNELKQGLWYVDVHSSMFPNGEIRGQISVDSPFVAVLGGAQQVPANASVARGFGRVSLNKTETQIVATLSYNNLSVNQQSVSINGSAMPGVNAPVLFGFGTQGTISGAFTDLFFNITPAQVAALKAGQLYFNITTANFPNGEIRGQIKPLNKVADFDGDSRAELAVFRSSNGTWYAQNPALNNFIAFQWGAAADILTPADFDADGRTDFAVWRNGTFYIFQSATATARAVVFGQTGDNPRVVGDYDGDGEADVAVYRAGAAVGEPSFFYIWGSLRNQFISFQFGTGGDSSILADFDGDRVSDYTVYRQSSGTFYVRRSTNGGFQAQQFGNFISDAIFAADFDADAKADYAVFRFSGAGAGTWYTLRTAQGFQAIQFGLGSDAAVPADYDGDGRTDIAVYRAGNWFITFSSNNTFFARQFGTANDIPIPTYLTR